MNNQKTIRWKQRYENLYNAFLALEKAIQIVEPSEVERGGIIQFFEIAIELAWKTMEDFLEAEGFEVKSPRQVIKQAAQYGLLSDAQLWLEALEDRNLSTHVYNEEISKKLVFLITERYFALLQELVAKLQHE